MKSTFYFSHFTHLFFDKGPKTIRIETSDVENAKGFAFESRTVVFGNRQSTGEKG